MDSKRSSVIALIKVIVAQKLDRDPNALSEKTAFFSLGVTSLISEEIRADLQEYFSDLSHTIMFDYPNIRRLADHLLGKETKEIQASLIMGVDQGKQPIYEVSSAEADNQSIKGRQDTPQHQDRFEDNDIAIIGIAGNFPECSNLQEFWRNLLAKKDCTKEIPQDRWNYLQLFSNDRAQSNAIYSKWGSFINGVENFDPLFFHISHKEAEQLDPQQKLFLQCAWSVMEDGGYGDPDRRPTDNVGVYVGVTWNDFSHVSHEEKAYGGGGSLYWGLPNRASYFLNFSGPSKAIDTACSSSLVAIHDACRSLNSGECEMAIAGGVNLNLHPNKYLFLSQNHFLSSEGKCRSFGEGGDGYVPGEGVGAVLLKPLQKAIEDQDYIYGVIKGSAINHGGKVTGYTVPNPDAHRELIISALRAARLDADEIDYVECHGTGTALGDPIEISGLTQAFRKTTTGNQICGLGSVKSSIGHLEAAAGVAGLIKLLLCMQHRTLVGSLHAEVENKKIDFANSPFYLVKDTRALITRPEHKAFTAGISSFGAGGSNAHLIVQSFDHAPAPKRLRANAWLPLSADSKEQLLEAADNLLTLINSIESDKALAAVYSLGRVAHSLARRQHFYERVLIAAFNLKDLKQKLKKYVRSGDSDKDIYCGNIGNQAGYRSLKSKRDEDRALQWVNGGIDAFPFDNAGDARDPDLQKVPLPTYPFKRERCWVSDKKILVNPVYTRETSGRLHPLVDRNVSTLRQQRFKKSLDLGAYYLRDHLVADEHVIPGVCHLEVALSSAKIAAETPYVTLRDVWFTSVIAVKGPFRDVEIALTPGIDTIEYGITDPLDSTAFSRGKILFDAITDAELARVQNIASLQARLADTWSTAEVYARFLRIGIIQKTTFQVIKDIRFLNNEALCRIELDASLQEDFSQYNLHPTLMDGAVQTAMMLLQYYFQREFAILPFHFGKVKQIRPLTPVIHVHAVLEDEKSKSCSLGMYDDEGRLLVDIERFILKEMNPEQLHQKPNKLLVAETERTDTGSALTLPYYVAEFVEKPLVTTTHMPAVLLVLYRDDTQWHAVQDLPQLAGTKLVGVAWADTYRQVSDNHYALSPAVPDHFEKLAAALKQHNTVPEGALVLWGDQVDEGMEDSIAVSLDATGRGIFLLIKSLLKTAKTFNIIYASRELGHTGVAMNRGLSGLFKTLKVEKPKFKGRVVHFIEELSLQARLAVLVEEFKDETGHSDVIWQSNVRQIRTFRILADDQRIPANPLRTGGVYFISGGMGGIGVQLARHLSKNYQAKVFLLGRSVLDEKKQQILDEVSALGGSARYLTADSADLSAVQMAVQHVIDSCGQLNGIFHSAGVIEDDFILNKSVESFERVIEPKIKGTLNLDLATQNLALDFFVMFSSVTAIMGNMGQCDYGYGNAFMDYFSHLRDQWVERGLRQGKSLAINWPYWKEGGMVLSSQEEAVLTKTFGFTALPTETGMTAIENLLALPFSQAAVLLGDEEKIRRSLGVEATAKSTVAESNTITSGKHDTFSEQASQLDASDLNFRIEEYLKDTFSKQLKIPRDRLKADDTFDRYGLDSIVMIELIGVMEKRFADLPKTLFFEYQSIADLKEYFAENYADSFASVSVVASAPEGTAKNMAVGAHAQRVDNSSDIAFNPSRFWTPSSATTERAKLDEPVAIIGLAGHYPKARNLNEFWQNLKNARDCVVEIPTERWNWQDYFQRTDEFKSQGQGKSYGKWGSFIDDVDKFDPQYFNITPKEAKAMDPQERLFLQIVTGAIEDAGYRPDRLDQRREGKSHNVGVYVGNMWGDYQLFGQDGGGAFEQTPQSFFWSIANRVSYFFNFSGPSFTVDSACSSSFTALHLACDSVRRGDVSVAIVGAVNLSLHPQKYALLSRMKFLSTEGKCRAFGQGGDGYVPGEGVGAVILKPLSQAIKDRDHIYGTVRSTTLNHGGKTSGFTVPNPNAQADLVSKALADAGLKGGELDYLEAHGTGTDLGDPVEISGLNRAFKDAPAQSIPIGSVKANYGHLEAAAGLIAMTKVLMQFKHRTLVPSIHSEKLNSKIDFSKSPFKVQHACSPWPARVVNGQEIPRIAGISSFGAGGANAHVIIEEGPATVATSEPQQEELIVFSAKSAKRLTALLEDHLEFLLQEQNSGATRLADIAFTLATGRVPLETRLAIVATSVKELRETIAAFLRDNIRSEALYLSESERAKAAAELFGDHQQLEQWVEEGALKKLALAWSAGQNPDFEKLFKTRQCFRVSLPTYNFEKESYWVAQPEFQVSTSKLDRFIDENVSLLDQQQFVKTFKSSDPLLQDHNIQGNQLLPAAIQLEMVREAIARSTGVDTAIFEQMSWRSPVICNAEEKQIFVRLYKDASGGWFDLCSFINDVEKVHTYGKFRLENKEGFEPSSQNIEAIISRCQRYWSRSDFYSALKQVGLVYGASFQETSEVYSSRQESLVKFDLSGLPNNKLDAVLLHPAILDGAFRAALSVGGAGDRLPFKVPVAIDELRVTKSLDQCRYAYARLADDATSDRFDIDLLDPNGVLLGQIIGLSLKALSVASAVATKRVSGSGEASPAMIDYLIGTVARVANFTKDKVHPEIPFKDLGIDSIIVMELNHALERTFGELSKTLFYEYENIAQLAGFLSEEFPDFSDASNTVPPAAVDAMFGASIEETSRDGADLLPYTHLRGRGQAENDEPIAVIGYSGRFPQADNIDEFWSNLKAGRDCIEEIPFQRWDYQSLYQAGTADAGKISAKWGGFINRVECFDPLFFQISPLQAKQIDPQERLFLQTCWEALEIAGYTPERLTNTHTGQRDVGVFVGFMWSHYGVIEAEEQLKGNPTVGITFNSSIANRVSNFCDFKGPSFAVDVACASSLLSIHLACESLRRGECRHALAGGVNVSIHPTKYKTLTQMGMLASDGRCRSFGEGGDGYVPGEGVGAVLLKPLRDAQRDGDRIHMVIRGSAVNHGGKSNGYTVPSPDAQSRVINAALDKARVTSDQISYVETHGTGTALGDPIEVTGLTNAFNKNVTNARAGQFCAIGSVKSNIGHLESAAGIASFIKVLLQMQHGMLVPSLHSARPNPNINFSRTPFFVQQRAENWQHSVAKDKDGRRFAIINSFAAGGTNTSMVVEEFQNSVVESAGLGPVLILVSAKKEANLNRNIQRLIQYLDFSANSASLVDIAYTLQVGREAMPLRLAVVAQNRADLLIKLKAFVEQQILLDHCFYGAYEGSVLPKQTAEAAANTRADLEKGNLSALAQTWTQGYKIDWQQGYPGRRPNIVPLPTYAFSDEKHWMNIADSSDQLCSTKNAVSAPSSIHPLLDENLSSFKRGLFRKRYSHKDFFVRDHQVQGQFMLPGVAYIEMARAAAAISAATKVVGMRNVVWYQPFEVPAQGRDLYVGLQLKNDIVTFECFSANDIEGAPQTIHSRGEVQFANTRKLQVWQNLEQIKSHCSDYISKAQIYKAAKELGFLYGPTFQAIDGVYRSKTHALCKLNLDSRLAERAGEFVLHPSILDAALVSIIGIENCGKLQGKDSIPFAIDEVIIRHSVRGDCIVHAQMRSDSNSDMEKYQIQVLSLQGELLVLIDGFSLRARTQAPAALSRAQSVARITSEVTNKDHNFERNSREFIKAWFADNLAMAISDIHEKTSFETYGVDSIIIVKLNQSLEELFYSVPKTLFFEYKNLDALCAYFIENHGERLRELIDGVGAVADPISPESTEEEKPTTVLFRQQWRVQHAVTASAPQSAVTLVAGLTHELVLPGRKVIQLNKGGSFAWHGESAQLNLNDREHWKALLKQLNKVHPGSIDLLYFVPEPFYKTELEQQLKESVQVVLAAFQGTSLIVHSGARILVIHGQAHPLLAALNGFSVAAQVVNRQITIGAVQIDITAMASEAVSAMLANELDVANASALVRYDHHNTRYVYASEEVTQSLPTAEKSCEIRANGVYLITGGMGTMGKAFTEHLLSKNVRAIILTGRSRLNREQKAYLKGLKSGQTIVEYLSLDVSREDATRTLYEEILHRHGQLNGIIHAAGISADKFLLEASVEEFSKPFAAKIRGAVNLDRATQNADLDFMVLFSSITARIGDFGSGGYAYANEYLNQFAVARNARVQAGEASGQTIAIGWPLWQASGMAIADALVTPFMKRHAMEAMATEDALKVFDRILQADLDQVDVFVGQRARMLALMGIVTEIAAAPAGESASSGMSGIFEFENESPLISFEPQSASNRYEPIAVVGIAGRYPQAEDIDAFWRNLMAGKDCIEEIPQDRWSALAIYDDTREGKGKSYSKWGGFISGVDLFDADYFNISPKEAELLDPNERLFLHTVTHALDDAGYSAESLRDYKVGVFAGVMWGQYQLYGTDQALVDAGRNPGSAYASIANRVSFFFGFNGPSMAIDTMCSSSLSAIHLACRSIHLGESDAAIAGGVNLNIHANKYRLLSQGQFVASDGRCRSFGEGGDGYVPGEGVGAVVLKRLSQAEKDGDHIYGVIRGSALSHGGRNSAYHVPNPNAQAAVIEASLRESGWDPRSISYIEAHGTGTSLGDPIEIAGLTRALWGGDADAVSKCAIGSVKSNVGHLEAAAGVCGLTKVLLQMKHQTLVPSIHSETLNKNIQFGQSPFQVQHAVEAWRPRETSEGGERGSLVRRAGLSSFGAGGSNAHLLIEEYVALRDENITPESRLVVFSAGDERRLRLAAESLMQHVRSNTSNSNRGSARYLRDLAFTLQVGRAEKPTRMALLVSSMSELEERLNAFVAGETTIRNMFFGEQNASGAGIAHLMQTGSGDEFIQRLVDEGDLGRVAQLWCLGVSVNWQLLYRSHVPSRISLPGTPLLGERFWVGGDSAFLGQSKSPVATSVKGDGSIHPLIDTNNTSIGRYLFRKFFTGEEFYLDHHRVQGAKVLPGVAYLEIARAVAQIINPQQHFAALRNLMWIDTLEVDAPRLAEYELVPYDHYIGIEINSSGSNSKKRTHASAEIYYARDPLNSPLKLDIEALIAGATSTRQKADLYRLYGEMGFGYGTGFQVTEVMYLFDNAALSRLQLPDEIAFTLNAMPLHPSLLDAAVRTSLGLEAEFREGRAELVVPFALGELRYYKPLTSVCYAFATREPASGGEMSKYRILVVNEGGELLVEFSDFSVRRIKEKQPRNEFYKLQWGPQPLTTQTSLGSGPVLVFDFNNRWPANRTRNEIKINRGLEFRFESSEGTIDPSNPEHYLNLFAALFNLRITPAAIVHCVGLQPGAQLLLGNKSPLEPMANGLPQLEEDFTVGLRALLLCFQGWQRHFSTKAVRCLYVFAADRAVSQPTHESVAGFARSLVSINPRYEIACLALDGPQADVVALVNQELYSAEVFNGAEVCYRDGQRLARNILALTELKSPPSAIQIKKGACILITGGLGKLGRIFAEYLAQSYGAKLVLTGRSKADRDGQTQEYLNHLKTLGAPEAIYISAETADSDSMQSLVNQAVAHIGVISGVIHCAGIVSEINADVTSLAEFDRVLDVKTKGLLILDQVTVSQPLEFFILFSSISSLVGDFGSGSYGAANRFMDAFAELRNEWRRDGKRSGMTVSMGWPLWAEGGMDIPENERAIYFDYSGMAALTREEGVRLFESFLAMNQAQLAAVGGNRQKIHKVMRISQGATDNRPQPEKAEVARVSNASAPKRGIEAMEKHNNSLLEKTQDYLKAKLSAAIELPVAKIDIKRSFESYGMDSILIMEMNKSLKDDLPEIPKTVLFEYTSIRDLANYLVDKKSVEIAAVLKIELRTDATQPKVAATPQLSEPVAQAGSSIPTAAFADIANYISRSSEYRYSNIDFASTGVLPAGNTSTAASAAAQQGHDRIAIVGLNGRYPQADNLDEFWQIVREGRNVTSEIPADRWDFKRYFHDGAKRSKNETSSKWGGFIPGVDLFDAGFFNLSRTAAAKMDPQLRALLESAWHCVEDAGYRATAIAQSTVGVYIGVQYHDFSWLAAEHYFKTGKFASPGSMHSELANHISYFMDLRGPSITVETACSSSLTAIHMAKNAILSGECDMAIAGGVNLSLHHSKYLLLDELKVLSPTGTERTFDERADGYVPSEGVGTVLLKRLSAAEADGDHIYGIIEGSAISHAGKGAGQYLPNLAMLARTFDSAVREAGVSADAIEYLESHGTGTALGDPIELKSIANYLGEKSKKIRHCALGTKANLGHLEAASGICSITKVLLSFKHGEIPPCANLATVNEVIDTTSVPFYMPEKAQVWSANQAKRYAAVNSFGMGGSNCFVVLSSPVPQTSPSPKAPLDPEALFILSAKSKKQLRIYAQNLHDFLAAHWQTGASPDFEEVAYTLQVGREAMSERLAIVASSKEELLGALKDYFLERHNSSVFSGRVSEGLDNPLLSLMDGDAGVKFIDAILQARQFRKLATTWISGIDIDWWRAYRESNVKRLSLPGYPFDKSPCWLEDMSFADIQTLEGHVPAAKSVAITPAINSFVMPEALRGTWFKYDEQPSANLALATDQKRQFWQALLTDVEKKTELLAPEQSSLAIEIGSRKVALPNEIINLLQHLSHQYQLSVQALLTGAWALLEGRVCHTARVVNIISDASGFYFASSSLAFKGSVVQWLQSMFAEHQLQRGRSENSALELRGLSSEVAGIHCVETMLDFHVGPVANRSSNDWAMFPLLVHISVAGDSVVVELQYNKNRLTNNQAETLLEQYLTVVEGVAAHPGRNPATISIVSKKEKRERFFNNLQAQQDEGVAGVQS